MKKSDIIGAGFAAAILMGALGLVAPDEHRPAPAQEIRLIGECRGKYYGAMEEDQFPATGCTWIEPIRVDVD